MNVEYISIDDVNILDKKNNSYQRRIYMCLILFSIILSVLIGQYYHKKDYYNGKLMVLNSNEVITLVDYKSANVLFSNNRMIINKSVYDYHIYKSVIKNQQDYYYEIYMKTDLVDINLYHNIMDYKIEIENTSLLEYITKIIKGGE